MSNSVQKLSIALLTLATVMFVLGSMAAAQTPRSYPCYRLAEPPAIDGKPDDTEWQSLPEATGFYTFKHKGFAVRKPTSFRIGWTKDALYAAVRCKEPFIRLIMPVAGDGEPLWDDDSVEFFVAPPGDDFLQFIANTIGARWNGKKGQESDTMWNWTAKARVAGDDWFLEMRIPFDILGKTPKEGDTWRFNVARNMTCGPANERFSSWAPVKQGFGDSANFAALIFHGAPAAADDVAAAEQRMGAEFQAFAAQKAAGNAVVNGSFENGMQGWGTSQVKHITIDAATATVGKKSIRLDKADRYVAASQTLKLKPATKYILRCDIKRTKFSSGTISVDVIERDSKDVYWTHHRCGDRHGKRDAPNAWGHYELRFRTSEKLLESMLMLYNINSGAGAWYDNIELVEDDGSDTGGVPRIWTGIRLELQARDASAKLVVNGKIVAPKPGKPLSIRIQEGISVIGIDARAQGPNPGVKVRIAGDPQTDARWRVSGQEDPAWTGQDFDDNGWPPAVPDAQGFLWAPGGAQRTFLRQVVLWNQGHDGPDRCINPLIKEWGISAGAMETLSLMLYSHFPFALESYEFVLDVPTEFRLLDIMHENGRNKFHLRPANVSEETTQHGGRPYTRYRITLPKAGVGPNRIGSLLLPVFLEKWSGQERVTAWYYRRLGKGNFTELEQKIPIRVLPPINGRFPEKIMISQYCSVPWWGAQLSPEHLDQHLRQSFQAGFNTWIMGRYNLDQNAYIKTIHDKVLKAGGRIILWSNYPFFGIKSTASLLGYRWLQEHAQARARYFEDSDTWKKRDQYCPTYVLGEGRAAFLAEVKKAYASMLTNLPASIIWSDWEEAAWVSAGAPHNAARDGQGSWCFCDRCKAEFRKRAGLPADEDLSDAAIFKNHKTQWDSFRTELDARVAGIAKQAANELGKPYMLYSWSAHKKLWIALKGNIDLAFPGCPGNSTVAVGGQKNLDDVMRMFINKVGLSRAQVMGQEFAASYAYGFYGKVKPQAFLKNNTANYVDPKLQKRGILRVVAALGLGVDLCNSLERAGGMLYWIGEATRILATYEDIFHEGVREDALAACDNLDYPNVLVLKRGDERLVLLFNEGEKPLQVTLRNKDVQPGQTATVFGTDIKTDQPAEMTVAILEQDVAVVHISSVKPPPVADPWYKAVKKELKKIKQAITEVLR